MSLELLQETPSWTWPEEAGSTLLAVLEDAGASESDRVTAAELAADIVVINDELADALLRIVSNATESVELRGTAAIALGPALELADTEGFDESDPFADPPISEVMYERVQRTLRTLFRDAEVPSDVRRPILEASVRAPQDWHADAVRAAYHSEDELWRLTAVFSMHEIRGFDNEIVEALESRNSYIRYEAVHAAGAWSVRAAWPHILGLLASPATDRPLLLAAIEAAPSIRRDEAADLLYALMDDSDDEEIRLAVNEALAMAAPLDDEEWEDEESGGLPI